MTIISLRYGIITALMEGMTAQNAPQRHPPAAPRTVARDRLQSVRRAGWIVTAVRQKKRRNRRIDEFNKFNTLLFYLHKNYYTHEKIQNFKN